MPEPGTQARLEEEFVTEVIPVGLPWRLLIFSVIIFGFAVSIYFGLRFGYGTYLSSKARELDKKIEALGAQVKQEDQQNFINFYSQLINLKKVLDRHIFASNVFGFLERNTLAAVYYTEADFSADGKSLGLVGRADSAETLVQQLSVFDQSPDLEGVILEQMTFGEKGGTVFSIKLVFGESFFKTPKQ